MAMSLTACGGGSDAPAADTKAAGSEAAGSEAAGAEGGTIKLGVIGPLTGPAATYGIAVQNGADLAVKEINAAGGVDGMMFEIKAEDDENDSEKTINAYNTLKRLGYADAGGRNHIKTPVSAVFFRDSQMTICSADSLRFCS